jgi:hypothetical protein
MAENRVLSWLDSLSKVGGLVAGVALIGSVAYDWAYLYAIGASFSDIPTSVADHIRSALNWMPNAVLVVGIVVALELFLRRSEQGMTEEELIRTSPHPRFTAWFRKSPSTLTFFVALTIPVFYILFGHRFSSGLGFAFAILWFSFSSWVNSHPRIMEKRSPELRFVIHWLPPVVIWIASMGYTSGAVLWYPVEKPIHSTLYLKNEAAPIQLRAIRFFDKGIVYKSAPDLPVVFVKWEDVIKIEKPTEKPWQGVIKKWFDFPNDEIIKIKEKSLEEDKKK